jgi:glycosyltransferase involved in cell wall biosynthesis
MEREPGTLVFLSYWGTDEPLTGATVVPTVRMLLEHGLVTRVVLCTVERGDVPPPFRIPGCMHVQWRASGLRPAFLGRTIDMLRMCSALRKLLKKESPVLLMARGVVAGGMAHFATRHTHIPYAVDYFEPHPDYMVDAGVWWRHGPFHAGLSWLMRLQQHSALRVVTVARGYAKRLVAAGVPGHRVLTAPCPVDPQAMRFGATARAEMRQEHGLGEGPVGIYVGKFGGLYHRGRSYALFARFLARAGASSHVVVLTPEPISVVQQGLAACGADMDRVHVLYAPHHAVPRWLSAADVAFAPYRGSPSSASISPVKIGEYWANGLPVVLTRGVGDDSDIIAAEPYAGALFDPKGNDADAALDHVLGLLHLPGQRQRTAALAERHRPMRSTEMVYANMLQAAQP